jgi:hypothetical protein
MTVPQAPDGWRKSKFSGGQTNCVEVGRIGDGAAVRDTKNRDAGYLAATASQWQAFMNAIKGSKFDR